jgi:hypothetical protein
MKMATQSRQAQAASIGGIPVLAHSRDIVRYLRLDLELTEADLATATGATTRTVRRWLAEDVEDPQARYADRLDDLRMVIEHLDGFGLPQEGIRNWLRWRNVCLGGSRPLEDIGKGEFDQVQRAAQAFAEGYYV